MRSNAAPRWQIAVSIDGPTDFTTWSNNNLFLAPTVAAQQARSSAYVGNTPANLAGLNFLRIHAEGDIAVTPDQGCELASRLPNPAAYYLNSNVSQPSCCRPLAALQPEHRK